MKGSERLLMQQEIKTTIACHQEQRAHFTFHGFTSSCFQVNPAATGLEETPLPVCNATIDSPDGHQ